MKHFLAAAFVTAALSGPVFAETGLPYPDDVNASSQGSIDYYGRRIHGPHSYAPRDEVRETIKPRTRHKRIVHRAVKY
jgi:hypothetical protein